MLCRLIGAMALVEVLAVAPAFALGPGDLAFTAFNADEDGWALVALGQLPPGATVFLTENAWDGSAGRFVGGEAYYRWDIGVEGLAPGTTVRFSSTDGAGRSVTEGMLTASGAANLSASGESLFAYLGTDAHEPSVFLAALSTEGFVGDPFAGTGLAAGTSALVLPTGTDFGEYLGPRSGLATLADYRSLVNDPAYWSAFTVGNFALVSPDMTAFTLPVALAEPRGDLLALAAFVAFALLGLGPAWSGGRPAAQGVRPGSRQPSDQLQGRGDSPRNRSSTRSRARARWVSVPLTTTSAARGRVL